MEQLPLQKVVVPDYHRITGGKTGGFLTRFLSLFIGLHQN
jgi:hypothetical protein